MSLDLDEDALPWALFRRLDDGLFLAGGDHGETFGTLRVALRRRVDLVALFHVGEAVVEEGEDVGGDLLAEAVTGAESLVDPHLHGRARSFLRISAQPRTAPPGLR